MQMFPSISNKQNLLFSLNKYPAKIVNAAVKKIDTIKSLEPTMRLKILTFVSLVHVLNMLLDFH